MATTYDTKKRHSTSKTGIFYRFSTASNGNKDKTYYIVYKDENNKTVESKVGKASQGMGVNTAHRIHSDTIQKIKLGAPVPIKRKMRKKFTLENAFTAYIAHVKTEKKTWKKDEELYNNHLSEFHQLELVGLTKKQFSKLKNDKLKKYSKSTVNYILAVARQIINFAIRDKLVKNYTNPISEGRVNVGKIDNASSAFFTKEQADKLLEALKVHRLSTSRIYELTVLLLHTGARFSEVASLTWDDVDFEKNTIYFKPTKDGNERHISMSTLVEDVLTLIPKNNDFLLPSIQGEQIKQMPDKVQCIIDSIIPKNKITIVRTDGEGNLLELSEKDRALLVRQTKKRLTVHSLRHTHASWMAISGDFNLMEIRDELGHKTTQMTERYSHLLPNDRHVKVNKLFG